ncbi:MAG TPA: hypothetical protein VNR59_03930 [Gaiellaceae bacterium]|nr:hypothetical protein [Gaiellaceae bacterium]
MRRFLAIMIVTLIATGAGTAAGARGGPGKRSNVPPPFPTILGVWSHDERNVKIKGVWHTMILDHGRVTKSTALQLTLREPDGTIATIPLSPATRVTPLRFSQTRPAFRRGMWAITMRIDDGAAVRLRLTLRP